jgi:hypothetical protein
VFPAAAIVLIEKPQNGYMHVCCRKIPQEFICDERRMGGTVANGSDASRDRYKVFTQIVDGYLSSNLYSEGCRYIFMKTGINVKYLGLIASYS